MNIIHIDTSNTDYVTLFIEQNKGKHQHFRYFDHRQISCLNNHLITLIGCINDQPIAYGHIDCEHQQYWLGICVHHNYQHQGYGTGILTELLTCFEHSQINVLNLTVDKDNGNAIHMYEKVGFVIETVHDTYYHMILLKTNNITIPVSIGEAVDKLTILEIKSNKIRDQRVNDVKTEYDMLNNLLKPYINQPKCQYLYHMLKNINQSIWDKQDKFKYSNLNMIKTQICTQIIAENDTRFRIKNKINQQMKSKFKEQKGYKLTKAVVLSHCLIGDQILMIPAVRYLSLMYDEVYVYSIHKYITQVKQFYQDDPQIKIIECADNWWKQPSFYQTLQLEQFEEKNRYICGMHTKYLKNVEQVNNDHVPFCFYRHINLPYSVFWEYFYTDRTKNSTYLWHSLQEHNITNFIFAHTETGNGPLITVADIEKHLTLSINDVLIVDPNTNHYSIGHPFYQLAQQMCGHIINDYVDLLVNATYLYLSDSCFFCLAMLLGLKSDHCYVRSRFNYTYDYIWSTNYDFNPNITDCYTSYHRKIFKPF